MEFKELTNLRRSCRNFKEGRRIDDALLRELVELANQAPSWKNTKSSRYHIVSSPELVERIQTETLPEYNQNTSKNAAAYVVTSFVKNTVGFDKDGNLINELGNGWGIYDLGLHNMNFILAAKDRGIDSLILGLRDVDKIREILHISEAETIVSVIALGYQEEQKSKPVRKSVDELAKVY